MPSATPSDNHALMAYAESLRSKFEAMTREGPARYAQAHAVQVTEKSKDGLITVTVGPRGELIRLDIDPRIYRRPDSRALADSIADTIKKAAAAAQERVMDIFEGVVPRKQMQMRLDGDLQGLLDDLTAKMQGRE